MKKIFALMMTMALAFGVAACGSTEADADVNEMDQTVYKIGVIQYAQHSALNEANKGFFAALDEAGMNYMADQQNAEGEKSSCDAIAETLAGNGNDLIFAIGTPAAQAAAKAAKEIPIVLTAVTDPAELGLVDTNKVPGGNITGTSGFYSCQTADGSDKGNFSGDKNGRHSLLCRRTELRSAGGYGKESIEGIRNCICRLHGFGCG